MIWQRMTEIMNLKKKTMFSLWFILLPPTPSPLLVAGPLQPTTKTPQKGLYRVVYILTFPHPHIHRSGLVEVVEDVEDFPLRKSKE